MTIDSKSLKRAHRPLFTCAAIVLACTTSACEQTREADLEPAPTALADTISLGGLGGGQAKADTVDWATAGMSQPGEGFTGNFARAQGLMFSLASHAYGSGPGRDAAVAELGFVVKGSIHSAGNGPLARDADAFSASDQAGRMNVIALRGTQEAKDYVTDLLGGLPTIETRDRHGAYTVHMGFSRYADAVRTGLADTVRDSCEGVAKKPLWVTGHSLGGGAATILAYRLKEAGCNVAGVSVFGSPRVGQSDWQGVYAATGLNPITQRWNYGQDPMVCLPPGGGWKHVGIQNHVGFNSPVKLNVYEPPTLCNTDGFMGAVKAAIEVGDLPARFAAAANDWLTGLIDLSIICDNGIPWKDALTLGTCRIVDNANRLVQAYNIAPGDLLATIIGFKWYKNDHDTDSYEVGLGDIDYPTSVPGVNLHVVIEGSPAIVDQFLANQILLVERSQNLLCIPERAANGEVFCDFFVADGYQAAVGINRNDALDLSPSQDVVFGGDLMRGPTGCTDIGPPGPDNALVTCFRDMHGPATIELVLRDYVIQG